MIRAKDNPFRSDLLDAMRYLSSGPSFADMVAQLQSMDYTAALVGGHGRGKSTLLRDLERHFKAKGMETQLLFISLDEKLLWRNIVAGVHSITRGGILFFDGANHLPRWRFLMLRRLARKRGVGLVITSHVAGLLPTLVHCKSDPALLIQIVHQLLPAGQSIANERLEALLNQYHGNVRDCLFHLYDEFSEANPDEWKC